MIVSLCPFLLSIYCIKVEKDSLSTILSSREGKLALVIVNLVLLYLAYVHGAELCARDVKARKKMIRIYQPPGPVL